MTWGVYLDDLPERRDRVRERDDRMCQQCGASDAAYVQYRTPVSEGGHGHPNLETICRSCYVCEAPIRTTVAEALANTHRLRLGYRYPTGVSRVVEIDPYGLTKYDGTAYLVGYGHFRDETRVLEPTRIKWADLLPISFTPPADWDTAQYLSAELSTQQEDEVRSESRVRRWIRGAESE